MAFPNANARHQYLKTQVETATKEQLVVMLFDGIIRFTEQARKCMENKEIENSHNALMRAQAIIMELICTVDREKGGEIASNLLALHAYCFNSLIRCNIYKDISKIDEVQKVYRELREGWIGAMESLGIGATKSDSTPPAGGPQATPPPAGKAPAPAARTLPAGGAPKPATPPPAAPAKPAIGPGGTMAMAKPASAAAAPAPAKPVMPAVGYAMGRSAALSATPAAQGAAPEIVKPIMPMNAKQAAMLNAYQAGSRSIA